LTSLAAFVAFVAGFATLAGSALPPCCTTTQLPKLKPYHISILAPMHKTKSFSPPLGLQGHDALVLVLARRALGPSRQLARHLLRAKRSRCLHMTGERDVTYDNRHAEDVQGRRSWSS
jgi:hypothetical protein